MPKRAYPKEELPTVAIIYDPKSGNFSIGYCEEFMEKLTDEQVRGVIKHELYHFLFNHLGKAGRGSGAEFRTKEQIQDNIAMDLAINSLIPIEQLPEDCYIPGVASDKQPPIIATLPKGETYEVYLEKLKEDEEFQKMLDSLPVLEIGSHDHWGQPGNNSEDVRRVVGKAIREVDTAGTPQERDRLWGSVPQDLQSQLYRLVTGEIDWRAVMARFLGRARATTRRTTFRTMSRRVPWLIPGIKKNRTMNALLAMDQSGSVSDAWLAGFFSELNSLGSLIGYTLIPFDCEVRPAEIQKVRRGQKVNPLRVACGGTDFDAPIKYVNEVAKGAYDCLIILTDGCAPEPVKCNIPVLYILPDGCELEFDAEYVCVKLDD